MSKRPGFIDGKHWSDRASELRILRKEDRLDEEEALLLKILDAVEEESLTTGRPVPPYYYERLANLYRKQHRKDEVAVLERLVQRSGDETPRMLLERLERVRERFSGELEAFWVGEPRSSPVIPRDFPLVGVLRGSKTFGLGSRPLVSSGAPLRVREGPPRVATEPAELSPPPLEKEYYTRPDLDRRQQCFYRAWKQAFERGVAWTVPDGTAEAESLINYVYTYMKDLVPQAHRDPGRIARRLEQVALAYPQTAWHALGWARDGWLLAGDLGGALACSAFPELGGVSSFAADVRLTMKYIASLPLRADDLFAAFGSNVTESMAEYLPEIRDEVDAHLLDGNYGQELFDQFMHDPHLETMGWPLWNGILHWGTFVEEAPLPRVSALRAGKETVEQLQRDAENVVRESVGLPRVGEGWIAETQLFYELEEALDTRVIHHGRPQGFGKQHLDVWLPDWSVGVEYQGAQHLEPVEFFGGETGFEETQRRDEEKRRKAEAQEIELVYVFPDYELEEVIARIRGASRKGS